MGQPFELLGREVTALSKIGGVGEGRSRTLGLDDFGGRSLETVDVTQADAHRTVLPAAAPPRLVDIHRPETHPAALAVLDQGCGVIEAHRPGVEKTCVEGRWVVGLEVGGGVDQESKAGGV